MDASSLAAIRFGLGRTPGGVGGDPAGWLRRQLAGPDAGPAGSGVAGSGAAEGLAALRLTRDQRRAGSRPDGGATPARELFRAEMAALVAHAATTTTPFRERLVWFWANHFTVSTRKGEVAALAGAFVRDAIRPHVTGRFADMLLAVMRHPAMLLYLDNAQSAGPQSVAGLRQNRGLNENLARECLELHTLGAAGGFGQADVTAFAQVLTGWGVERRDEPLGFRFRPAVHQPGEKQVMGMRVPEGEAGGVAVLAALAVHPATFRHLAQKLVRHFVADEPPADAVRRVEGVLRDTRGDLGAAAAALVGLPAAWRPLGKVRTPFELVVAAARASGLTGNGAGGGPNLVGAMAGLGQPLFGAKLPNGWPDVAGDWTGPEAMMRRVDWAYGFAGRPELPEPGALADAALGPGMGEATATAMRRAGSRRDAITLLLASPEFQRR